MNKKENHKTQNQKDTFEIKAEYFRLKKFKIMIGEFDFEKNYFKIESVRRSK